MYVRLIYKKGLVMNIKLLMMITGAMVLSGVGFASTAGSPGTVSPNVVVNNLPGAKRPEKSEIKSKADSDDHDDLVEISDDIIINPKKYGRGHDVANYVYQARNNVIEILQADISALEEQAVKMEDMLLKLEKEDADYSRTQVIAKEKLMAALLN